MTYVAFAQSIARSAHPPELRTAVGVTPTNSSCADRQRSRCPQHFRRTRFACSPPPEEVQRCVLGQRSAVGRCINKIKQWRGLDTLFDKIATIHLAGLYLDAIFIGSARCSEGNGPGADAGVPGVAAGPGTLTAAPG